MDNTIKFNLPQIYFSKLMRAITEFELIKDNDRIMIGVSGGKDSIFLAYAMAMMRQRLKKRFELMAVTINPMFSDSFDISSIKDFMQRLDIPHHSFDVDIKGAIDAQGGKDPCYTCAFFRRGAVNRYAKEQGCNKVAYAHHNDDAVETLFMGLLYSGQIHTFIPSTYLDKTDITVIRPLVYFREQEIIDAIQYHQVQPVPSPCPNDGHTIRQRVKDLIREMSAENPQLYPHLASAMRENAVGELWPAPKNRKEMKKAYYDYMYGAQ